MRELNQVEQMAVSGGVSREVLIGGAVGLVALSGFVMWMLSGKSKTESITLDLSSDLITPAIELAVALPEVQSTVPPKVHNFMLGH